MTENNAFQNTFGLIIDGVHTDIICHKFTNKILLLITQYEKIPNVMIVQKNRVYDTNKNSKTLSIQNKFGTDNDEITAAVRYLMANTGLAEVEVDVVLSLGLKTINKTVLKQLTEALQCIEF